MCWRAAAGLALGLLGLAAPGGTAWAQQEKATVKPGGTVNINVTTASSAPPVSILLHERHGHVEPCKGKCTHTGGGLIDVTQPSPDVVLITMTGLVIANSSMKFDLEQCFEVKFDDPKVKAAKLTIEARVVGLLRGEKCGCASYSDACAHLTCGPEGLASLCVPPHSACGCDSLSVNDHDGPKCVPVVPCCKLTLNQTFLINAEGKCCLCKRPSAEFAPDPALDPLWISYWEPFHGVKKDTFGFQVMLKVAPESDDANNNDKKTNGQNGGKNNKGAEALPGPQVRNEPAAAVVKPLR
jgi:hypothetical protein